MNFKEISENHKRLWIEISKMDITEVGNISFTETKMKIFKNMFPEYYDKYDKQCFLCEVYYQKKYCPGTASLECTMGTGTNGTCCLDGLYRRVMYYYYTYDTKNFYSACLEIAFLNLKERD